MLLVLLVPLRRLTVARSEAGAPAAATLSLERTPVRLALTATATPIRFQVAHLGAVIWRGESGTAEAHSEVTIPFPPEGIDLALKADWSDPRTAAVRLSVERDGEEPIEQTVWGEGSVDEVLTFK